MTILFRLTVLCLMLTFAFEVTAQNLMACFNFDNRTIQDNISGSFYGYASYSGVDRFGAVGLVSSTSCSSIGLGNNPTHMPTNSTISFWCNVVSQCSLSRRRSAPILSCASYNNATTPTNVNSYTIGWDDNFRLTAILGGVTFTGYNANPYLLGWNHYTLTFNDTTAAVYLNGALVDTQRLLFPITYNLNTTLWMASGFLFGGATNLTVDDLMIYDSAMNEAQVLAHYQANAQCAAFPTALDEVDSARGALKIFPNPTNGRFEIENKSNVIFASYTVHDMTGRILSQGNFYDSSFEFSYLPNGLYLLSIMDEEGRSYHDKFQIIIPFRVIMI